MVCVGDPLKANLGVAAVVQMQVINTRSPVHHKNDVVLTGIKNTADLHTFLLQVGSLHPSDTLCLLHCDDEPRPAIVVALSEELLVFLV